jgi:hypothetical protein
MRIYFVALSVKYRPQQSLITQAFTTVVGRRFVSGSGGAYYNVFETTPAVSELTSGINAAVYGYADDGSGTYSGTANGLLSRGPDILCHLLCTYGGLSRSTNFETGTNAFGSFVDARTYLMTMENTEFTQCLYVDQMQTAADVARGLAGEMLAQVIIDVIDGKFRLIPWRRAQPVDYDLTLSLDELLGTHDALVAKPLSSVGVAQNVQVNYGQSPAAGSTEWTANVAPLWSDQGFSLGLANDQLLKVVTGTNDVLKFSQGGVNKTATFAQATYLGIDMAAQIVTAMNAGGGVSDWTAGWGFAVKAAFNDTPRFSVDGGVTTLTPTIAPFSYTPEACCAAVQKAMNAAQATRVFTVSYSRSTGKVTISATGGTFIFYFGGTNSIGPTLGFTADSGAVTTVTGSSARKMEQFWAYRGSTNVLQWTNALTTCAGLLGFDTSADQSLSAGGATGNATYRRGDRQTRGASSVTQYGDGRAISVNALTIRATPVAADLRDRLFDLRVTPRVMVQFKTHRCPDLQRGRVIQFSSTLDAVLPYPRGGSDGSWGGKAFRVTEVVRNIGPVQWSQEVTAWEIDPVVTG